MHFSTGFTLLLASVMLVLLHGADAVPMKRNAGMITMPIRSIHGHDRKDLHPQLYLQQQMNRAERRLARMAGREAPSDHDLHTRMQKRMYIIGAAPVTPNRRPGGGITKRYRKPTALLDKFLEKAKQEEATGSFLAKGKATGGTNSAVTAQAGTKAANVGTKAANAKAANAGATAATNGNAAAATNGNAAAATNGNVAAATNGNVAAATNDSAANATGGNTNAAASQGVSQVDINAAIDNTLTKANPPTGKNSLGLDIEGADTGYIAQVQIGTPPKNFEILMDSGSADLWVGSENCQSQAGGGCGTHQFLGTKTSSTFVDTKAPFNVTYGTGQVSGTIIRDNINIAGLKLNGHTFGTADVESVDFSADTTKFDGLMGLAQSGLSQQQTATPVEALAAQGLIPAAITSYKIPRLADQKNDGEITFGGLDTTKFDSNTLVTLPNVNQQGFWEANMDAVTVDGQDVGLQGRTAILDTGTTLIVAPPADAAAVHKLITGAQPDGQGGFTLPCTTTQSVALTFGGKTFNIDPRDIAPLPLDPANPTGTCASGIAAGTIGGAQEWLVGDVFLKNAYFSTDVQKNTVSLAKLV